MMLALALLALLAGGCRGPQPCVAVSSPDQTGQPVKRYDEFTRVTSISSAFVLTPDQEWTLAEEREDGLIHWGIELWLRANSAAPTVDIAARVSCLHRGEQDDCVDCDNVCTPATGRVELLADGQPIALPAAKFRRIPGSTPEGESATASTILLAAPAAALAPLEHARSVKLRVCGSIVATLTAAEADNLREFMRHLQFMMAPR
ncbi:MAG TPA: hypothetical protein VFB62_26630 [Polyangiaceae bacterium]|jgi:hypothetical protein|nr:hypothetical protein [Polyangiaceae bacterium]